MRETNIVPSKTRWLTDSEMTILFPQTLLNEVRGVVKLKFSHLLEIAARTRIRIVCSKYVVAPTDVYLITQTCGEMFLVGELVYQFLKRYQFPNTYDYAWFVAWMNGLDRPYVSVG